MKAELNITVENGRVSHFSSSLLKQDDIEIVHRLFHLVCNPEPDPVNGRTSALMPNISDYEVSSAIERAEKVLETYDQPESEKPAEPPKRIALSRDPEVREFVHSIRDQTPQEIMVACEEKFGPERVPSYQSINAYQLKPKQT